jgi:hypothetical protein
VNCTSPTGDRGYRGQIQAGHPDVEQLCRALADWSTELRLLLGDQTKKSRRGEKPGGGETDSWHSGFYRVAAVLVFGLGRRDRQFHFLAQRAG